MPRALSFGLRSRIAPACQLGELHICRDCQCIPGAFEDGRETLAPLAPDGSAETKPHGGGLKARLAGHDEDLRHLASGSGGHDG
jgi:hypothetical protein